MSQQRIDSIIRKMITASNHVQKNNFKKALRFLEDAEAAAKKEDLPDFTAKCLFLKGNVLDMEFRDVEAMDAYEEAFELSSHLFLDDPEDYYYRMILGGTMCGIKDVLQRSDNGEKVTILCEKYGDTMLALCDSLVQHDIDIDEEISSHYDHVETLNNILECFGMAQVPKIKALYVSWIMEKYLWMSESDSDYIELGASIAEIARLYGSFFASYDALNDAEQVYMKFFELYDERYKVNPDDLGILLNRMEAQLLLGGFYAFCGRVEDADSIFSEMLQKLETLSRDFPLNYTYKLLLIRVSSRVSLLKGQNEDYEASRSYLENVLSLFDEIRDSYMEPAIFEDELLLLFEELAELFESIGDIGKAESIYLCEIGAFESLIREGNDEEKNSVFIAETYNQLARLFEREGDMQKAGNYFQKEMIAYGGLHDEYPNDSEYEERMADVLMCLGILYSDADSETSLNYFRDAVSIYASLTGQNKGGEYKYAMALNKLAVILSRQNDYDGAIAFLNKAVNLLTPHPGQEAGGQMEYSGLADLYFSLSNVYGELGDTGKEIYYISQCIDVYSCGLFNDSTREELKDILVAGILLKKTHYMDLERYDLAKGLVETCYRFYGALLERDPDDLGLKVLYLTCQVDLGDINYHLGFKDEAIDYYLKCQSCLEDVGSSCYDDFLFLRGMNVIGVRLGMGFNAAGELLFSKKSLESSMRIQDKMMSFDSFLYLFERKWHLRCLDEYADVLDSLGMHDEAVEYKAKAEKERSIFLEECTEDDEDDVESIRF
ncbi:tetratricopeptide repeat protein [uncultured Methanolobus sp.]|uniref:tetratricopeptide repeat protein n=1 Tax=uncultured Methanolobus sp. TaxID=218300 RepID=UPI002AABCB40|nr:tetratricopeptide repeat protein [uncultured Methanolobus sp.]